MINIPSFRTGQPVSTQMVEDPQITKLYQALQQIDNRPNIITLSHFRQFEPLFRKNHGLTDQQIVELSERYGKTIDFYKETQIIHSGQKPTVVLTLPPLFTPVRTLSSTNENEVIVAVNQKMFGHPVPKYSSDAFNNMMNALKREQIPNKPVIDAYHQRYITLVDEFFATYQAAGAIPAVTADDQPDTSAVPQGTEWDFDS